MKTFYLPIQILLLAFSSLISVNVAGQNLEISSGDVTIDPFTSVEVIAIYTDSLGDTIEDANIKWHTEPGYLGKVNKQNMLEANHPGEGFLIAKYRDSRDSVVLVVNGTPKNNDDNDDDPEDEYPKVKIVPSSVRVEISDSVELRAFYIDSTGTKVDTTFTWSVEPVEVGMFPNPEVGIFYSAELPSQGTVIATLGELADTVKITVYESKAKKEKKEKEEKANSGKQLTIEPGDMTVYTGHEPILYTATYKTNGNKHQDATFLWSVSDTTVAKINEAGLLTLSGETGMTLVTANYSNFEAAVELIVVDSTVDLDVNTISIRRVLPNGNELHPKYFKEGETYKIGGLPYPLNILNAGMLHFPYGCISEDIDIYMFIPEEYAEMNKDSSEVNFSEEIITGVKFSVVPAGSDTIVDPYYFNIPVELKLIYKSGLLDSLGVDPHDLNVFFAENAGFIPIGDGVATVDTARNRIYASIEHFSTIVVKAAESTTNVSEIRPDSENKMEVYPNPFSSAANFEFNLEKTADVQLSIYNMLGQQIKVLVNGEMPAGKQRINWDGENANGTLSKQGIYICRLIIDGQVSDVKRLIKNH